ncbi:MAG TPA: hypothetical protein VKE94_19185, partial [Gemmataceae bacterium]|nr:hypothetical protein [Gemmataceae bacterium]
MSRISTILQQLPLRQWLAHCPADPNVWFEYSRLAATCCVRFAGVGRPFRPSNWAFLTTTEALYLERYAPR